MKNKANLTPKKIRDKNGKLTTVWVNNTPDQKKGKPIRGVELYHWGVKPDGEKYRTTSRMKMMDGTTKTGYGVYFTEDKIGAEAYKKFKPDGKLHTAKVTLNNPKYVASNRESAYISKERYDKLKSEGYDGVVFELNGKLQEVVVFDNKSIDQKHETDFKKWFKGSKMVNKDGTPMTVYHGTNREFKEFRTDVGHANDQGYYGKGIYFTFGGLYSKGEAAYYGDRVIEAHVRVVNPFDISSLSTYKNTEIHVVGTESMVFLWNIARKFPEIADQINLRRKGTYNPETEEYEGGGYESIKVLPALVEKYRKKLKTYDVDSEFKDEKVRVGYVESTIRSYTTPDGKVHSYEDTEDLGRWRVYEKDGVETQSSKEEIEIGMIMEAIEQYEGLSYSYFPEGIMTRHPEITEAIKKKGHDGIVQSMDGDEVVVFNPDQIYIVKNG